MTSADSTPLVLTATLTIQALATMCLVTLPAVAPAVARDLDISAAFVGGYIAIAYIGAVTASLLAGPAVRRWGAIRASQAGLAACATGIILCTLPSLSAVVAGALCIGLGYGPITPASSHLLARSTPPERMSFVFSVKQTGVPIGGVLAGIIVPGLTDLASWQLAFLAVAGANLLCAILVQPLCATLDADRNPAQRLSVGSGLIGPLRLVFSHHSLTVLAVIAFMLSITQLSLTSYLVTFLHDDLSMTLVTAGLILAVAQAAGIVGRLFWGYLADHLLGANMTIALLAGLIVLCAMAMPFLHLLDSIVIIAIVLSLFGVSAIGWNGVFLAEVARQAPPGQASTATGGALSMNFLGVVLGPPLFGVIAALSGSYGLAYAALALPPALCVGLLWASRSVFAVRA